MSQNRHFHQPVNKIPPAVSRRAEIVAASVDAIDAGGLRFGLTRLKIAAPGSARGAGVGFHKHLDMHLQLALDGRFVFRSRNRQYEVSRGRGIAILPGCEHKWHCEKDGHLIGVGFDCRGDEIGVLRDEVFGTNDEPAEFSDDNTYGIRKALIDYVSSDAFLKEVAGEMLRAWLKLVIYDFLPIRLASSLRGDYDYSAHHGAMISNARNFMQANSDKPITLENVASHVGTSVRHLNRLFHEHQRVSPYRLLIQYRMERAKKILREDKDGSIKKTAINCGFSSASYFCRSFRREFGISPGEYRRS